MACFLPAPRPSPQMGRPGQKPGSDPNRSGVQTGQFPSPHLSPRIRTMPPLRVLEGGGDTWQCLGWVTREAGDCCHFSGSRRAPLSLGPAHTFLRDSSDACGHARAHTHTHPHTLPISSMTPGRWTGQDTARTSNLHIPPARELPPASRSINNEPGTRGKKSEQQSQCQELEAQCHPVSSALASGDRLGPSVPEMNTPPSPAACMPRGGTGMLPLVQLGGGTLPGHRKEP